jgi:hypothetical protein
MLAIETRYIGPTNTRGSKVIARVSEELPTRKITLEWDNALNPEENHKAAAAALIKKLDWTKPHYGDWYCGGTKRGYVFVCATRHGYDKLDV